MLDGPTDCNPKQLHTSPGCYETLERKDNLIKLITQVKNKIKYLDQTIFAKK
jgi:hypothetical protein